MFFNVVITKVTGFILLVEALDTQPFRRLPAFLANCQGYI
jgi:hypothetical protein